ncbi:MAG: peptide chain release factor N(5)-glutamine methyltransferase [Chloroflexota bacterium]
MRVGEALGSASQGLAAGGFEEAPLEAEVLLRHVLGVDRAKLYSMLGEEFSEGNAGALRRLVDRRLLKEPIAYIVEHREFFGLDFRVGPGVLIPRPESELLVEQALGVARGRFPKQDPRIADVGTGSGAIAISLAVLLPKAEIYATDVSPRALEIAGGNCERHGVQQRVRLLQGEMLSPVPQPVDIVVANLPYVSDADLAELGEEVRAYEPVEALAGGADGLDKVRQLLGTVEGRLHEGGEVLLEVGSAQSRTVASLAEEFVPDCSVELVRDLAGAERVVKIRT